MTNEIQGNMSAWTELIKGLTLLALHPNDPESPSHCEHDQLTILANPREFTDEQLTRLGELGFHPGSDGTFYSFRFGSA
jgi:hypothetical protein